MPKARAALGDWRKAAARWVARAPQVARARARPLRLIRSALSAAPPRSPRAAAPGHLRALAWDRRLLLLTATRQPVISEAAVLAGQPRT